MASYCPRCMVLFEMARRGAGYIHMVLPPHDPACPKVASLRPAPLPRMDRVVDPGGPPMWARDTGLRLAR